MDITAYTPETVQPRLCTAALVDIRSAWSGEWQYRPDIRLLQARVAAASQDLGSATVTREYGHAKYPHDDDFETKEPLNLRGGWIRVRFAADNGLLTAFVGRIEAEVREVHGAQSGPEDVIAGTQTWTAYPGAQLLRKRDIVSSWWLVGSSATEIHWIPAMNTRDGWNTLVGNRSQQAVDGTYLYGGTSLWTRRQYVDYLLARFADWSESGGPKFTLGGQVGLLDAIQDAVYFGDQITLYDALRHLIHPSIGLDFVEVPTSSGFELRVFSLVGQDASFASATLPGNPASVIIDGGTSTDRLRLNLVDSGEQQYGKIRVVGGRVRVVFSLFGAGVGEKKQPYVCALLPKWNTALETAYKAGTGDPGDLSMDHDEVRRHDVFRPVYRMFGAETGSGLPCPLINVWGVQDGESLATPQAEVRATEPYLPLFEGLDYSTDPATAYNASGHQPGLLPIGAWLYDESILKYAPAEERGVNVSTLPNEWGVMLTAYPNHKIAKRHFDDGTQNDTQKAPDYDYEMAVVTLCALADARLAVEYDVPGGDAESVKTVLVPEAEMWWMAPKTVTGVDLDGALQLSGGNARELRNDNAQLNGILAGAIARYARSRHRAELEAEGYQAWADLVGKILRVVIEGGEEHQMDGPITEVVWIVDEYVRTTLKGGYAL